MSFADKDELDAFISGEGLFPRLTGDALKIQLRALGLALSPGKDFDWLAKACRRVLYLTLPNSGEGPDRPSNAAIVAELNQRALIAQTAWIELFKYSDGVDRCVEDLAWDDWNGEGESEVVKELPLYARYRNAIQELDWLSKLLRNASKKVARRDNQGRRWKESEYRELRIDRAHHMAPVFELAFGEKPTASNAPSIQPHNDPTAFAKFYQATVSLAFDERATPNLPHVLKIGLSRHRKSPVTFNEGVIPNE